MFKSILIWASILIFASITLCESEDSSINSSKYSFKSYSGSSIPPKISKGRKFLNFFKNIFNGCLGEKNGLVDQKCSQKTSEKKPIELSQVKNYSNLINKFDTEEKYSHSVSENQIDSKKNISIFENPKINKVEKNKECIQNNQNYNQKGNFFDSQRSNEQLSQTSQQNMLEYQFDNQEKLYKVSDEEDRHLTKIPIAKFRRLSSLETLNTAKHSNAQPQNNEKSSDQHNRFIEKTDILEVSFEEQKDNDLEEANRIELKREEYLLVFPTWVTSMDKNPTNNNMFVFSEKAIQMFRGLKIHCKNQCYAPILYRFYYQEPEQNEHSLIICRFEPNMNSKKGLEIFFGRVDCFYCMGCYIILLNEQLESGNFYETEFKVVNELPSLMTEGEIAASAAIRIKNTLSLFNLNAEKRLLFHFGLQKRAFYYKIEVFEEGDIITMDLHSIKLTPTLLEAFVVKILKINNDTSFIPLAAILTRFFNASRKFFIILMSKVLRTENIPGCPEELEFLILKAAASCIEMISSSQNQEYIGCIAMMYSYANVKLAANQSFPIDAINIFSEISSRNLFSNELRQRFNILAEDVISIFEKVISEYPAKVDSNVENFTSFSSINANQACNNSNFLSVDSKMCDKPRNIHDEQEKIIEKSRQYNNLKGSNENSENFRCGQNILNTKKEIQSD